MDADVRDAMSRLERAVDELRGVSSSVETTTAIVAIDAAIAHAKLLLSFQVRPARGDPSLASQIAGG
jgi:hypothetical protein